MPFYELQPALILKFRTGVDPTSLQQKAFENPHLLGQSRETSNFHVTAHVAILVK